MEMAIEIVRFVAESKELPLLLLLLLLLLLQKGVDIVLHWVVYSVAAPFLSHIKHIFHVNV